MSDPNPPAFPAKHSDLCADEHGMTLRDWFAGQLACGFLHYATRLTSEVRFNEAAEMIFNFADALIVERAKRES